ncbi:MAG: hypothetical protein JNK05_14400 [Myxococcales bacterium]|nr:hypothetical protein [Myxococcales bacterium]
MRSVSLCIALGALFACEPRPTASVADVRATAWGEDDDASVAVADSAASDDASDGAVVYQGPPVLMRNGRPAGFIRFVHMAPGAGRVRFIARSASGYERGAVDVEVDEGSTSGYLPTINVPHRVRVVPASAGADAGAAADLSDEVQSDVYNNAGCTVAFGGHARWVRGRRTQDPEVRRLVRVVDIPRRDARTLGMLRFMAGVAGVAPITIREGDADVYERLPFMIITGMRRMPAGAHEFNLRARDGSAISSEPLRVDVPGGEAHTLWIFAERGRRGAQAVRYLLTNDVPAGRIGPDFTGEMPVYR